MSLALDAGHAILFFHCHWGYSWFLLPSIEKWEREWLEPGLGPAVALFMAVDDGLAGYPAPVQEWVRCAGLDRFASSGNGEMIWLERGRVVSSLVGRARQGVTPDELTRRTAELWGLE